MGFNDVKSGIEIMDIVFIAGMIDRKLASKILPLQKSERINRIFLVRKKKFLGKKIYNFNTPSFALRYYFLSELIRFVQLLYIIFSYRPKYIIAAGLIPHGIYAYISSKVLFRKSILLLMGEMEFPLTNPPDTIKQKILTHIVKRFDNIGVRGTKSEAKVKKLGFNKPVFIANNIFDFNDFFPIETNKEYDFIFIGNISREKRLDLLLKIIYKLKSENNINPKGLIIGEGKLKARLIKEAENYGLDKVSFLPFKQKDELNKLLNKSKVFLLTSEYEGLPMVVVEAMACGVPSVCFDIADITDLVEDGVNGSIVEFGDLNGFKEKLNTLLQDQKLYDTYSKACIYKLKRLKEEYSIEYNKLIWEKILN